MLLKTVSRRHRASAFGKDVFCEQKEAAASFVAEAFSSMARTLTSSTLGV